MMHWLSDICMHTAFTTTHWCHGWRGWGYNYGVLFVCIQSSVCVIVCVCVCVWLGGGDTHKERQRKDTHTHNVIGETEGARRDYGKLIFCQALFHPVVRY